MAYAWLCKGVQTSTPFLGLGRSRLAKVFLEHFEVKITHFAVWNTSQKNNNYRKMDSYWAIILFWNFLPSMGFAPPTRLHMPLKINTNTKPDFNVHTQQSHWQKVSGHSLTSPQGVYPLDTGKVVHSLHNPCNRKTETERTLLSQNQLNTLA